MYYITGIAAMYVRPATILVFGFYFRIKQTKADYPVKWANTIG